jgi:colicin import membrane protein
MALDSTLSRRDALMPQRPGGLGRGTALAVLAHIGLVIALAFGVSWRSQEPAGVSAELWAAVPQAAAPPAIEPTPVPKPAPPPTPKVAEPPPRPSPAEAQIAIEKEKAERARKEKEQQDRDRAERDRLEREKAEKLAAQQKREREAEAKRQKEEEQRLAKQREENLKRVMGEAGGTGAPGSTGTAAREAGPSASYAGRIKARVKPNIVLTDDVPGNPTAEVEVRCAADGTIVGRRLVKSSGQKAWDEAVLRAIDRTEILPRDTDGRVPGTLVITFRPQE